MEEARLNLVRKFLNREDLSGAEAKLKNQCIELDQRIAAARADFQTVQQQLETAKQASQQKQLDILSLSQRLEGLCDLVVSLSDEEGITAEDEAQE